MLGCRQCLGIWMDNHVCQRLVDGKLPSEVRAQIRNTGLHDADTSQRGGHYRTQAVASDRACVRCGAPLTPYTTSVEQHGAAVRLDVCAEHGTWFDQGEAWALLQAVELKRLAYTTAKLERLRRRDAVESTEAWVAFIDSLGS
jgi:Zn-finger nucleic acid-binding protein